MNLFLIIIDGDLVAFPASVDAGVLYIYPRENEQLWSAVIV